MNTLDGKSILVTGASSGIGRSVCLRIHEQGGRFLGVARREEGLRTVLRQWGDDRHSIRAFDVTDFDRYPEFVEGIGPFDGVVHSAGDAILLPIRNVRKEDLERAMAVHLYAPVLLTSALLKAKKLNLGASIVFLSSTAALSPDKAQMPYALAKSSLLLAARCMTAELSEKYRLRFNSVLPGLVETPMLGEVARMVGQGQLTRMIEGYPLGSGQPQDVASVIAFLLSDDAHWISGASFVVDGGMLCKS